MKVCESLYQVLAERTVLAVHPKLRGLRKKRDEVKPERARSVSDYRQAAVYAALCLKRSDEPGPSICQSIDLEHIGVAVALGVLQIDRDVAQIIVSLKIQREVVTYILHGRNGGNLCVDGVVCAALLGVLVNTIAVGCDAEALSSVLYVKSYRELPVAQVVVILVVRVPVIERLQVRYQRLVFHHAGGTNCSVLAYHCPGIERGI